MKYLLIILLPVLACCRQQSVSDAATSDGNSPATADQTMSDSAKQALIDISSTAWLQVQTAEVALKKTHDTSLLAFAQNISKQFTRVKDKAKIVSIPYRMNMPYFLSHDQNEQINKLKASDENVFSKEFITQVEATNLAILQQCNTFESLTKGNGDVPAFITFIKSVVDETDKRLTEKK